MIEIDDDDDDVHDDNNNDAYDDKGSLYS